MTTIYIVRKDKNISRMNSKKGNILVTDDPDRAKRVRDRQRESYHTFIEVWDMHAEEPKYVTRKHPDNL